MSVSVCQVGVGHLPPPQELTETATVALIPNVQTACRTPLGLSCDATVRVSVHICVRLCALACCLVSVCACPCVTGWTAAVLESLLTESVGPAEYFYPLVCVSKQVEGFVSYNKVTRR